MKKLTLLVLSLFLFLFVFLVGSAFAKAASKTKAKLPKTKPVQQASQAVQEKEPSRKLVVYFSATGHTADVALVIAKTLNISIVEIIPAQPYVGSDLDWQAKSSRASKEHADPASRPAIQEANLSLEPFDTIYLGFPIWWGEAPRIILTYIETHNLAGKKIILFATSGGSGFGNTVSDLQKRLPKSEVIEGKVFPGFMAEEEIPTQVEAWLKTLNN